MPEDKKESKESSPSYELQFEEKPGYLIARVSGEQDSVDISISYFSEVVQECKARKYKRLLIIEDLEHTPPILDVYTIASQWSELGRGLVGAFVDLHPEHNQNNIFGENVAINRGLIGRMFSDVPSAEAWLEELSAQHTQ